MDDDAPLTPEECARAIAIARSGLEAALAHAPPPDAAALEVPGQGLFREKGAAFVTLTKGGALRGCIGHILAFEPLWQSIRDNAAHAALEDRRFAPVTPAELPDISVEVTVLAPPRPIAGPDEFVVGVHGVILEKGPARAVFLPQVATEQGWDRETTLTHLAMKAGLSPGAWREPTVKFKVFTAAQCHEAPL